jgi:prepilin-type N-terminal cleavage/methylation domain-containing protein
MKKLTTAGFTLVETLVAVSIISLSVTAPLFAASRALVAAEIARDKLTASYLAQEGIEYVRAMRDDEFLAAYQIAPATASTDSWNYFLNGGGPNGDASFSQCIAPAACTLDPFLPMGTGNNFSLNTVPATPLYLTAQSGGAYVQRQTTGTRTAFTRTIWASSVSANEELITSTVTWSFHGTPYTVTVKDHLTPWQ